MLKAVENLFLKKKPGGKKVETHERLLSNESYLPFATPTHLPFAEFNAPVSCTPTRGDAKVLIVRPPHPAVAELFDKVLAWTVFHRKCET